MSASAWRICPQCLVDQQKGRVNKVEALVDSYGKVPLEEWLKKQADHEATTVALPDETLREDYEIYINEGGNFRISYSAVCEVCGFQHSFNHEEQLEVVEK